MKAGTLPKDSANSSVIVRRSDAIAPLLHGAYTLNTWKVSPVGVPQYKCWHLQAAHAGSPVGSALAQLPVPFGFLTSVPVYWNSPVSVSSLGLVMFQFKPMASFSGVRSTGHLAS